MAATMKAIAAAGLVLGYALRHRPALAAATLRFYWFRLADVALPLGLALGLTALTGMFRNSRLFPIVLLVPLGLLGWSMFEKMEARRGMPPRADGADVLAYRDWLDICRVAREATPRDARFLTPRHSQTFHWYAERAEVVNWKNIPQDAESIVEWAARIYDVYATDGRGEVPFCEQGTEAVLHLADFYDAGFVITLADPPLELRRLAVNRTYALYAIPNTPHARRKAPSPPRRGGVKSSGRPASASSIARR